MSIPKPLKKINIVVLIAVCVVLGVMVTTGGLKLGSISRAKEPVRIFGPTIDLSAQNKAITSQIGLVIASKTGSKYHLPDCPGAKTIAEKNKVVFASPADAERAGYSPAANCPGLKSQ